VLIKSIFFAPPSNIWHRILAFPACAALIFACSSSVFAQSNTAAPSLAFNLEQISGLPLKSEASSSLTRATRATYVAEPMPVLSANEFGTKVGDTAGAMLGTYHCRSSGTSSIDFQINVSAKNPAINAATLKMAVYDVDTSTESGNPEIDTVSVNGTKVGVLNGSNDAWFYNIFNIPVGLLHTGSNAISVSVDDNYSRRTSGTSWCVQVDWGVISITGTVGGSGIQIPRAWLTPTQVTGKSFINLFAEVAGDSVSTVKAYYDLGGGQLYELASLTDTDGDHVYSASFMMPELPTGFYPGFQLIAVDKLGNKAYWPGLQVMPQQQLVSLVSMAQLAGNYLYTDTTRSASQYYENITLSANGSCSWEEFTNSVSAGKQTCSWSYDGITKKFHLTYNASAYDDGPITGDTSTFTLAGKWYDGSTKLVNFSRLP